ncbi:hypothetical protein L2E82_49744 [Cichorium intybus]|uniref:Uncharacterized protein n=1 Tax=Cichorium intybus TaxID=13427 RepID=A0ACB8Z0X2_CICIN|nr:hypothetical protein L2E82_49744 [Cichorium intybus]
MKKKTGWTDRRMIACFGIPATNDRNTAPMNKLEIRLEERKTMVQIPKKQLQETRMRIEVVGQVNLNVHDYSHLMVMGPVNNLINECRQLNKEDTDLARPYDLQNGIGMAFEVESQKGLKDMSDKMKILLSRNTLLKDKLEKIKGESSEQRMTEMNGVEDKRKNYNISILEKRITRS